MASSDMLCRRDHDRTRGAVALVRGCLGRFNCWFDELVAGGFG